ncbi:MULTISPECIES: hypothetical protein [unclassified Streptomyces]|uniref:hypothetical protein n=1 Tax=unclassified Streptomyces TaxID=2593676 RepID=UPI0001C1BF4E|nr:MULTISPECIES: hypothetical protein [unclassified Streptomyces]AEN11498.1 conserved hypothetical protein [Streptomyces sp. SirexAA-E]MYR67479.1 hypothetical protein [Streptomyces sp. SID4939]MYS04229.1 hypothetical protein [Streptomyces sp. SID4940]MYT61978.1 hypothetical protein [Streptomyces sp. SID8357]MYT85348.1 hypothetical protein [Streptomyces sp. SID8360]
MHATAVRRTALAVSAVSLALLATACGGSDEDAKGDAKAPAAEGGGATKAAVKALTSAELEKVALEQGDVAGHRISRTGPEEIARPEDVTVDKKECEPIGYTFYGVKRGTPVGNAGRKVVQEPEKEDLTDAADALEAGFDLTSSLVTLASYDGDGAEKNLAELRRSAAACATGGFTLSVKGSEQKITKLTEEKVSGGEEALAWTATMEEDGVVVPFKLVSLRQAGTVATFFSFNLGAAGEAEIDFGLPSEVVAAQVEKLG